MKKNYNTKIVFIISTLITGIGIGWLLFGNTSPNESHAPSLQKNQQQALWTCSMHPQIRRTQPGICPLCGMNLVPVKNENTGNSLFINTAMSPTAIQLASIQTGRVKKQRPVKEIRLHGMIQSNENAIYSQTSHMAGRIEKLLISSTGMYIKKGQVIAYVYAPTLVSVQKELLEVHKISALQPALFNAVKKKLENMKLTTAQIETILMRGTPTENFPILADRAGVVTVKNINLGDYITQGSILFEVTDFSSLWIVFDIHESELEWIDVGDKIEYTIQAFPGKSRMEKIIFIDPVIDPIIRVAKARIQVSNTTQKLKPGMFVTGKLKSVLHDGTPVIIVPKTAVMWTGKRSIVYVASRSEQNINFSMRVVTLGAFLEDGYIIEEGLKEDEEIATHGTFSIDAAAQLAGNPSMMNPTSTPQGHHHENINPSLASVFQAYMELKDNLADDDFTYAIKSRTALKKAWDKVDIAIFKEDEKSNLNFSAETINEAINALIRAKNIKNIRKAFFLLSEQIIHLAMRFKPDE